MRISFSDRPYQNLSLFARTALLFVFSFSCTFMVSAQVKKKKASQGHSSSTPANTTVKQRGKPHGARTSSTPDNTTMSQSGNNNRFPSSQNATTTNSSLKIDKKAIKAKQAENGRFKGDDATPKRLTPENAHSPGRTSVPTDHGNYSGQRKSAMEEREKPSQEMHKFQGNVVVKKKSALDGNPEDVDHKNRQSVKVDHTKYQGYRKNAFNRKEETMEIVNSQGSAQYGVREEPNLSLEKRKTMRQAKERERFEYAGDELPKTFKPTAKDYQGDQDNRNVQETRKQKDRDNYEYSGDMDLSARDKLRKDKDKEIAANTGDIDLSGRDEMRRDKDKEQANYTGDLDLSGRDKQRRIKDKQQASYSGDISVRNVMKEAKAIRKKEKRISKYSGDILVKTLRERDNRIRTKAKKIANWQGDIVVSRKRKGAHPSAVYAGGKTANSYKAKEKYRRKMLKKYGRNPGIETPNYQRKKYKEPTYDKDESKIWDVQKYKDSKTK